MLFAITLNYIRPKEEIVAHLDAHKAWLVKNVQAGEIIFAGPLTHGNGGFILAYGESLENINKMMADDPFDIYDLIHFDINICTPAIRVNDFPKRWAQEAASF